MNLKLEDLRVGLVVQLNSGGAAMTVRAWEYVADNDAQVTCVWSAVTGEAFEDDYPLACLARFVEHIDAGGQPLFEHKA